MRRWLLAAMVLLAAALPAAADEEVRGLPVRPAHPELRLQGPAPQVFEQISRLYKVPVRVAEGFGGRSLRLRLVNADFETAFKVAVHLARAFWVKQPDGTLLVIPDTPENREVYQAVVQRTFPLPGRTSDELAETTRLLRELLEFRRIQSNLQSRTITLFDTEPRLAAAEKLLAQLPGDPGEVWVDVLLLEVDREESRRLGLVLPDTVIAVHLGAGALAVGRGDLNSIIDTVRFLFEQKLLPQAAADALLRALIASGGAFDPDQLAPFLPGFVVVGGGGTAYALLLPGAQLNLERLARVTQSSRRFELRARDGDAATLFAGERFPIAFTTFSSIFIPQIVQELIRRGLFVPPVPAVRYEDLGVKMKVTPRIHPGREVSLDFEFDQDAVTGQQFNGIPVLSSRELRQQFRLRDGETLLVSGLRAQTAQPAITALPVLGTVPVIGPLFRRGTPTSRETELFFFITPRIVRLPPAERVTLEAIYLGTEQEFAPPKGTGPSPLPVSVPAPEQPEPPQESPPPPQPQPPPQE
jgi:hypothetical protein